MIHTISKEKQRHTRATYTSAAVVKDALNISQLDTDLSMWKG